MLAEVSNHSKPRRTYRRRAVISRPITSSFLLPVDLDLRYEGLSKNLNEVKEDTGDGGYISVKRESSEGVNKAQVTKLIIKPINGAQASWKTRLKFDAGDHYKISKNRAATDLITSQETEFSANEEITLYLIGEAKSSKRGDEKITMQIKVNDEWLDGDSVTCTVVQTDFVINVRVFIPYNWVNIPHPAHGNEVAEGDKRGFDPTLKGTFRLAQREVINPYPDMTPFSGPFVEDGYKGAGVSSHYRNEDVINFDDGVAHSGLAAVQPSYIKQNAVATNAGVANTDKLQANIEAALSDDLKTFITFVGGAAEPIIFGAAEIDYEITVGIIISDPLNPKFSISGDHDGFPSYEVYINANHKIFPVTKVLQWNPPIADGVTELMSNLDETIPPKIELIK